MRTMRHLLLKTSTRRALIRTIRSTRKPLHGKTNSTISNIPEARVIPISQAKAHRFRTSLSKHGRREQDSSEESVRIIRLLTSFPQIA